jgi:hypothetical protein
VIPSVTYSKYWSTVYWTVIPSVTYSKYWSTVYWTVIPSVTYSKYWSTDYWTMIPSVTYSPPDEVCVVSFLQLYVFLVQCYDFRFIFTSICCVWFLFFYLIYLYVYMVSNQCLIMWCSFNINTTGATIGEGTTYRTDLSCSIFCFLCSDL